MTQAENITLAVVAMVVALACIVAAVLGADTATACARSCGSMAKFTNAKAGEPSVCECK